MRLIAIDRPIHAVVFLLFATGVTLIGIRRSFPNLFRLGLESNKGDTNLPLEEFPAPLLAEDISIDSYPIHNSPQAARTVPRVLLVGGVVSLVVRIELLRRILKATECTVSSFEV